MRPYLDHGKYKHGFSAKTVNVETLYMPSQCCLTISADSS